MSDLKLNTLATTNLSADLLEYLFADFKWHNVLYATEKNKLHFVEKGSDENENHECDVVVSFDADIETVRELLLNTVKRQVQDEMRKALDVNKDDFLAKFQGTIERTVMGVQPEKKRATPEQKARKEVKKMTKEARLALLKELMAEDEA